MLKKSIRKKGGRKFAKKRIAKKSISLAIKKYVKTAISKDVENKSVQINGGNSFGSYLESPEFNAYPMCPYTGYWTISQGVGAGNRVGNQIKPKRVMLNYVLRPLPYDSLTNPNPLPCQILLYLGYVKNTPSTLPIGTDFNYFFQSGNSSVSPVGNLRDTVSVINKDYWTIKKKWSHKIGYAGYTGTGSIAGNQFNVNNDFKLNVVKKINITKFVPNTLIFNDTQQSTNTKNLFFMYEAVSATGNTLGVQFLTANIEFWVDFEYEDA